MPPTSRDARPGDRGLEGRTIGVLSSLLAGTYFGRMIEAIAGATAAGGGRTVAVQAQTGDWLDYNRTGPSRARHVGWDSTDGFIVIIDAVCADVLAELRAAGKPLVIISEPEPGFACPVVMPDNAGGARQAVDHLVSHGHERIAFAGDLSLQDVRERLDGYRAALRAHGIEPDPSLVFPSPDTLEHGGREVGRAILAAGVPGTAVFAATDYNAVGIMTALAEAGLDLPRDQAVVGFDDMPAAALANPGLSTVRQSLDLVASTAVGLVGRYLSGAPVEDRRYEVPSSLVVRESCGCAAVEEWPLPAAGGTQGPVGTFVAAVTAIFAPRLDAAPAAPAPAAPAPALGATHDPAPVRTATMGPAELATKTAGLFSVALERDLSSLELLDLGQLSQQFYRLGHSAAAFSLMSISRQLAHQLYPGSSEKVVRRLDQCLQQVAVGLSRAGVLEQVRVNDLFHKAVWNEYNISHELLRSHEKDPRSLQWMARTIAGAGVLALWCDGEARQELEVVGAYDRSGASCAMLGERFAVTEFPPAALVERAAAEADGSVLLVLPVTTTTSDWGFLALAAPPESTMTGQETYFQWSALLSQALDYDAVTNKVRQRSEELAVSYKREREMADVVRQSEERYALAARAANDGLWDWDLTAGTVYYSERWKQMLGYGPAAIGTSPEEWLSRAHPDERPALLRALGQRRSGERGPFEVEHRVRAADGTYRWVVCRGLAMPEGGQMATRIVGSLTDVTERRSLEEQLLHQALYDALTGLPNRALFLDRLSQSLAYARREPSYVYAVLWLDLDGFKVVNDSLGHLAGDRLLVRVAERIRANLREADTAARFGGDEFAVLLHNVSDLNVVELVVDRLQNDLRKPYNLDGHQVVVTASIGIAGSSSTYDKAEDVLRDADIAMYRAKSAGRAGHTTFDASMYTGAISRLETESALREAIERDQLELHYQPIVELEGGTLRAMEVLVRWRHPERGLVPPSDFLSVAEESGLIVAMGRWVQMEACRQLAEWKGSGLISPELRTSINLSHTEFWAPGLLAQVDHVLATTAVPASWVSFEITEGVIMYNLPRALEVLGELHARGLQIHIDDFGTGYSSLEALHRLPIDALKIDRSFVANLHDDKSVELVRTIVQLGRNLGVDVIAEGIETPGQQHLLGQLGCPLGQGFWFSVPVPARRLGELLGTTTALPAANQAGSPAMAGGPAHRA